MDKKLSALLGLVLLAAIFVGFNLFTASATRGVRLDFTENKLFTLSEGARKIARGVPEKITLTFYYSAKLAQGQPTIQDYGQRVRDLLLEFARESRGMIDVKIVDPEPFSEAEDGAVQAGLVGVPLQGRPGESIYMGVVGTTASSLDQQLIPLFDPTAERLLEYDVAKLIYTLANPKKKVVGVITSLPIEGGYSQDPRTGRPTQRQPWAIMSELRSVFEVKMLGQQSEAIDAGVDVLVLIHPKNLSDKTLYAIDQYVLKGGKMIAFVDPLCESDEAGNPMMGGLGGERSSNLTKLFDAWGIEMPSGRIAGDDLFATPVMMGDAAKPDPVSYICWLTLDQRGVNKDDPVTSQMTRVMMPTAGFFKTKPNSAASLTPLLTTTANASDVDGNQLQFMPDPKKLLTEFKRGTTPLTLAARVSGKVPSAFPNGKPTDAKDDKKDEPAKEGEKKDEAKKDDKPADGFIANAVQPIQAIIVADVDMLADRFWARVEQFGGVTVGIRKAADNGDFLLSCVDNLTGSTDLISIRARGKFTRPFDRVDALQREAERKYREQQRVLEASITETQTRIEQIQKARPDTEKTAALGGILLTKEQEAEIEKLRKTMGESRKQLRAVQLNLRQDVEALGTRLKIINMAIMPALVALAAVGLGFYRSSRRRSTRATMARAE